VIVGDGQGGILSCNPRDPIDLQRIRFVVFLVERLFFTVKNIIGAKGHKKGLDTVAGPRQLPYSYAVYVERAERVGFAEWDIVKGRSVDDHARPDIINDGIDSVSRADIEVCPVRSIDLVVCNVSQYVPAELAGLADKKNFHFLLRNSLKRRIIVEGLNS
jgi:hypothetical protein